MNIHLTPLTPWSKRGSLPETPGVYLIRKGGELIYVGKTTRKDGLRGRIRQFNNSASNGVPSHAGGLTFHRKFGSLNESEIEVQVHKPTVVSSDSGVLYPYILYVERRLIWEHIEQHGKLPECNSM